MATTWTTETIASLTAVSTTKQQTARVAVAPNAVLSVDASSGAHVTDTITVGAEVSNDGGVTWAEVQAVEIPVGDVAAYALGPFTFAPDVRLTAMASGSTDLPTVSFRAKSGPLNGA